MLLTGSPLVDAERAFARASRARRRAALLARLRRRKDNLALAVLDSRCMRAAPGVPAVREIAIDAISGTVEPARAMLFDGRFRPTPAARARWQHVWLAEHRGLPLPPIDLVRVCDAYAVRDGHHRVSVALARGALTIDAVVE
jgi:hypothetical protein